MSHINQNVNFKICSTWQMKYFNNSLNSGMGWYSFKFARKLFNKTIPLNFDEFIPYFRALRQKLGGELLF